MRAGLVTKKLGMTSFFSEEGVRVPVTFLQVVDCSVVGRRTVEKNGYSSLIIGAFDVSPGKLSKPCAGFFAKSGVQAKSLVREFRVSEENYVETGTVLSASHFVRGQFVDVVGRSIGKGFAGGMKRHNFRGLEASHGVSVSHRSHGSTGGRQDPGKVFKNKKMAGRLGGVRVTVQNLEVVDVDSGIIAVKGSVPGFRGSILLISDAVKKK